MGTRYLSPQEQALSDVLYFVESEGGCVVRQTFYEHVRSALGHTNYGAWLKEDGSGMFQRARGGDVIITRYGRQRLRELNPKADAELPYDAIDQEALDRKALDDYALWEAEYRDELEAGLYEEE